MANNTTLNAGSGGDTIQTDDIGGGVKQGASKIIVGAAGAAGNYVDATHPLNVDLATVNQATVAVGHGVAATAIRVELPTDGTGLVKVQNASSGLLQVSTVGQKTTYSASTSGFTPVATPTDFFNIFGSASKTVCITRIEIGGVATAAAAMLTNLIRRSTAGTIGSAVLANLTDAKHNSSNASGTAVASTVGTANYGTVGTTAGQLRSAYLGLGAAASAVAAPSLVWDFTERNEQGIVLQGTSEQLALNWAGAAVPSGTLLSITVTWTEE